MAMNYQHRWGRTEERIRASRTRQPAATVPTPSALPFSVACPACGHMQSPHRLADYGCSKCRAATEPARSTCPHCATAQPLAGLVANGCRACGQMPNRPGRSLTARA